MLGILAGIQWGFRPDCRLSLNSINFSLIPDFPSFLSSPRIRYNNNNNNNKTRFNQIKETTAIVPFSGKKQKQKKKKQKKKKQKKKKQKKKKKKVYIHKCTIYEIHI